MMGVVTPIIVGIMILHVLPVFTVPLSTQKIPPEKTIKFMKHYGYLDAGPNSDALYTEEGFKMAVMEMQKFGGLPETGELDEETLSLTTARRCGLPDVNRPPIANRTKRYVKGSEAWKKRTITYFMANWPPEIEPQLAEEQLKRAFQLWSQVTPLKFVPKRSMEADIIIAFGGGPHGDGYPFDGAGGILAHAFFPYEHGPYGGDVHFDNDELWIDGATYNSDVSDEEGVDFFTVATHEIGHSLGLAHSYAPESVMFPYYKGYNSNMRMDYDDIVAMYDMYVVNGAFEDEGLETADSDYDVHVDQGNTTSEENENTTPTHEIPPTAPDVEENDDRMNEDQSIDEETNDTYDIVDDPPVNDSITTDSADEEVGISDLNPHHETEKSKTKVPDICEGSINAMAIVRGEIFIFKDLYVWRMTEEGQMFHGYPVDFHVVFRGFPWSVKKIDAVYQRHTDYHIIFFTGRFFWDFNGNGFASNNPRPLTELGLPDDIEQVDAALVWAKNSRTYLFSGSIYWRLDEQGKRAGNGYPQRIYRWKGVPTELDAAFTWKDKRTYFFKGDRFWRFNNHNISTDPGFPLKIAPYWFDCSS